MVWAAQLPHLDLLFRNGTGGLDGVGAPVHELGHGIPREQMEGSDAVLPVGDRHVVGLVPPRSTWLHDEHEALELDLQFRVEDVLERNKNQPVVLRFLINVTGWLPVHI